MYMYAFLSYWKSMKIIHYRYILKTEKSSDVLIECRPKKRKIVFRNPTDRPDRVSENKTSFWAAFFSH